MFVKRKGTLLGKEKQMETNKVDETIILPHHCFEMSWDLKSQTIVCSHNCSIKTKFDVTNFVHPIVMNHFWKKFLEMSNKIRRGVTFCSYLHVKKADMVLRWTPKYRTNAPWYDWCIVKWNNGNDVFENVPGKVMAIFQKISTVDEEPSHLTILLHSCHGMEQKQNLLSIHEKIKQMKTNAISECCQLEC